MHYVLQLLQFLLRDWQFEDDYELGAEGGQRYLEEKLKVGSLFMYFC